MKKVTIRTLPNTKLIIAMLVVAAAGFSLIRSSYADSGSLALSPSSGSHNVGDTFNVQLQESGASATTVQAVLQFPSSLQFIGDTNAAPFSFNPSSNDTASGNTLTITRSDLGSTGTGTVTTITFKVLSAGSATVSFQGSPNTYILPSGCASISCSVLSGTPGSATYSLTTPSSPAPSNPTPSPSPTATPATTPSTTNSRNNSVSVAPKSSGSSSSGSTSSSGSPGVTVPDNGSVAVNTPVTVEPTTIQSDGVQKVQYYLGSKLVDTETKPPYKYNIDTSKLKDGTYKLVSKTYYSNGTNKQTTQNLVVKNAAVQSSGSLSWLYLLIVGIILLLGLGVNFVGPSSGGGPFSRLFGGRGHSGKPSVGGPAPTGWPGSTGGAVPPSAPPPSTPVATPAVAEPSVSPPAAAAEEPAPPDLATRLGRLQPPHGPSPGTVFRPHG